MLSSAELKIRNGNDTVLSAEDVTLGKKQLEQGGSVTLQEGAPLERSLRLQHKVLGNTYCLEILGQFGTLLGQDMTG